MEPQAMSKLLRSIGISSGMILGLTVVAVGFYAYRNYYETVKLKYEIEQLKEDVKNKPRLF